MPLRTTLLLSLCMTIVAAQDQVEPPKKMPEDVGQGHVAWFDITTTSLPKSEQFYGKLFGWTFTPLPGNDQVATIVTAGTAIGTMRVAEGQISAFNGVVYIQVADITRSCATATALGATLEQGFPFDLPDGTGAIGLIRDPSGHPMGMYSRSPIASSTPSTK